MPGITPIPTTRVSNLLVQQRLLTQMQFDQTELFRIQTQLTTGRRIQLPSEDAPAALRAITLQRLIERKEQVQTNLTTNASYLSATDSALGSVSGLLADIRGSALTAVDSTTSETQRDAIAIEVDRAIQQLVDTGNKQFRGRFLFAGTRTTVQPFQFNGNAVEYLGNEGELQSYSDIDVLFESSMHGNQVFGALSERVSGTADLNPVLTNNTLLSDLRGGQGISSGSIAVSDGSSVSVVDIGKATTIGDVAALLENNPPAGRTITATVAPTGLVVEIDTAGGGNLTITEVGGGTTVDELGILEETGHLTDPVVGDDLNPKLRLTTQLDNILGSRAIARVESAGPNNDIVVRAATAGTGLNDVSIQFVDDRLLQAAAGLSAGNEVAQYTDVAVAARTALTFAGADNDLILEATAAGIEFNDVTINITATQLGPDPTANYDSISKTLTIDLEADGTSSANQIIAALTSVPEFTASLDTSVEAGNTGNGAIAAFTNASFTTTGNSGAAAGTLLVNIENGASTSEHVVDAINAQVAEFAAELDARDAVNETQIGLGPVELAATGTTFGGSGIVFDKDSGLRIDNGGQTFDVSFATAETVEDLLNILNGSGAGVLAEINAAGTGIDVRSRLSGPGFSIGENGGTTASELGIRSFTLDTQLEDLNNSLGVQIVDGTDFSIVRNDGVQFDVDLTGAQTIGDVIERINNHVDNQDAAAVTARLAAFGNGIELVDDNPTGVDAQGEPHQLRVLKNVLSLAAVHLGLIPQGQDVSDAPSPAAVAGDVANLTNPNTDLTFSAREPGTALDGAKIVFANAAVGDTATPVYDAISNTLTITVEYGVTRAATVADAVSTQVGGLFTAELNLDAGPNDGSGTIDIADDGQVAELTGGTPEILTAADVNRVETQGAFNTLIRLRDALYEGDLTEIQRTVAMLDDDIERVNFARSEIGARHLGLEVLQGRLEFETIELRSSLSLEIDVDFTEAISDLNARQVAFQAALQTSASVLQLSLMNFL